MKTPLKVKNKQTNKKNCFKALNKQERSSSFDLNTKACSGGKKKKLSGGCKYCFISNNKHICQRYVRKGDMRSGGLDISVRGFYFIFLYTDTQDGSMINVTVKLRTNTVKKNKINAKAGAG